MASLSGEQVKDTILPAQEFRDMGHYQLMAPQAHQKLIARSIPGVSCLLDGICTRNTCGVGPILLFVRLLLVYFRRLPTADLFVLLCLNITADKRPYPGAVYSLNC